RPRRRGRPALAADPRLGRRTRGQPHLQAARLPRPRLRNFPKTMSATILIVDDERDLLDSLRFSIEREGFSVVTAQSGTSALALIGHSPQHDLVLFYWTLPDMAGTEVCRSIRMSARTRHTPVIMISARGEEIDRVVGFELG